ncbi:MAG: AbrB/MazE/SpoVT family DNA-binding domain-containing protein [Candidatus Omnitrophica bacterium]|nr:AbrB/MazE/SpoVT family DNA-binding domain-containing protein [Candidatus Omnitrophota bacterium]
MIATVPKAVKLWGRGQLTIPKDVRTALHLEDEAQLTIFVVGRCLVMTPKRLLRASLARDAGKSLKAQGLSLDDVLDCLKEERSRYNRDTYGG